MRPQQSVVIYFELTRVSSVHYAHPAVAVGCCVLHAHVAVLVHKRRLCKHGNSCCERMCLCLVKGECYISVDDRQIRSVPIEKRI